MGVTFWRSSQSKDTNSVILFLILRTRTSDISQIWIAGNHHCWFSMQLQKARSSLCTCWSVRLINSPVILWFDWRESLRSAQYCWTSWQWRNKSQLEANLAPSRHWMWKLPTIWSKRPSHQCIMRRTPKQIAKIQETAVPNMNTMSLRAEKNETVQNTRWSQFVKVVHSKAEISRVLS